MEWSDVIDSILDPLVQRGLVNRSDFVGCSDAEIEEIAVGWPSSLPASYIAALRRFGKGASFLWRGTDFHYPEVLEIRESAEELLDWIEADFRLEKNDYIFLDHQGYQFLYFKLGTGDDPEVYYFIETEELPKKVYDSFTAWLEAYIQEGFLDPGAGFPQWGVASR
jgi:hypothetical protein